MVKKSIKPGRLFWVGTFVVGVFSPGKGKRRINDKMVRMDTQYKEALTRIAALQDELSTAYAELERRPAEDEQLKKCLGEIAECPVHGDHEETVPLPKIDPGVILVGRLAGAAGVTGLPGAGTAGNGS